MLVTTKYMYICGNMQYMILRYMLKEERHQYILNRINQNYRIYITALSAELGVSDDTLRRDLTELDERGLLTKVHGGAIAKSGIPIEFTDRLNTGIAAKQQMATKVIPLFHAGDILLMDGGTSNLEVAKQLPTDIPLSVYTNSFPIVNTLFNHPKLDLIFLGGKVFPGHARSFRLPGITNDKTGLADPGNQRCASPTRINLPGPGRGHDKTMYDRTGTETDRPGGQL